jgi:DNA-binding Lrp family transcriptional regulator
MSAGLWSFLAPAAGADVWGEVMDAIDQAIIRYVLHDARATYAQIGKAAGLSAPAAKRRLDRLVATGAIRGFTALVDPQALAWHTEAFVEVYCAGNPTPAELCQALEAIPEVVEACTVSGAADAVVHMLARDIPHLEQAIQRVRATAPVERTESAIVLSRLLNRPRV